MQEFNVILEDNISLYLVSSEKEIIKDPGWYLVRDRIIDYYSKGYIDGMDYLIKGNKVIAQHIKERKSRHDPTFGFIDFGRRNILEGLIKLDNEDLIHIEKLCTEI